MFSYFENENVRAFQLDNPHGSLIVQKNLDIFIFKSGRIQNFSLVS